MKLRNSFLSVLFRLGMLIVLLVPTVPTGSIQSALASKPQAPEPAASATTNSIHLSVASARTDPLALDGAGVVKGDPISQYEFIINEDNSGDPLQPRYPDCSPWMDETHTTVNPNYPESCSWVSVGSQPSYAPIVTEGNQDRLNLTTPLTITPTASSTGKYLISVLADGYKVGGAWFALPIEEPGLITVELQPHPLPAATISIRVFNDVSITNGAPDQPAEDYVPGGTITSMAGFEAHVADWLGETTTDVYGNPICAEYEPGAGPSGYEWVDGAPVYIEGTGGQCVSDEFGNIRIPNMGPNRWAVSVVPPDGSNWIQTSTLEGNLDWDTWIQEGATGYDTEFVTAGEPFPFTIFGFVQPTSYTGTVDVPINGTPGAGGAIEGTIVKAEVFTPYQGGLPYLGQLWGGLSGAKISRPIANPYIALQDLLNGDTTVYVGQGDANGHFSITGVPDGNYNLSYWDAPLMNLLDLVQVTVRNGEVVDLGVLFQTGWFTEVRGHVFVDDNENGKMDPGEHGVDAYPVVLRRRENSEMDRGAILVPTEPDGSYFFENMYPLNQWLVLEAYTDNYYTTGITFQATNQATETTILGNGVDVGVLPVIGQGGRLDWGVKPYGPGANGSIVGTVFFDTTRNELDPRYQAVEPWSPGIPNLTVNLYEPIPCGTNAGTACDASGQYELAADGSIAKGAMIETVDTEKWERPTDCITRDVDGNPVPQQVLPVDPSGHGCIEAPLMGIQFQADFATVNGNYGFGDLVPGDYLVEVVIPNDDYGYPLYKVVKEEDVNVADGDAYVPQPQKPGETDIPAPACAGALHTVDLEGVGTDGYGEVTLSNGITVPASNPVHNPGFVDMGGSPYEGTQRPLCDVKLVTVSNGRSVAPGFTLFTEVPIPGRFWGLIIDDLSLSTDPQSTLLGEKRSVPYAPVGIYDFTNKLLSTVISDYNGYFDVLMPSTNTINCPSPSGVCANLYRLVGNDPGQPGKLNPTYNPQYRTIAATFEVFPGLIIPADLAPTQVAIAIQAPGAQTTTPPTCRLPDNQPQFFAVNEVVFDSATGGQLTIEGMHFETRGPLSRVRLTPNVLPIDSWTDNAVTVTIPAGLNPGFYQLDLRTQSRQTLVNAVTIHILGGSYTPAVYKVGPGRPYAVIQDALNDASGDTNAVVAVYPDTPSLFNPKGVYYENLIMHSPAKLQGVGPGGVRPDSSFALGSVLSGLSFGGDTTTAENWRALIASLDWVGNPNVAEGAVITVLAEATNQFRNNVNRALIDGFTIEGGDQQGFPNNINQIGGGQTGLPPQVVVQGGGIFVNAYARGLHITNNVIQNNGGSYAGAIRIGTPDLEPTDPNHDAQNDNILIRYNQILANGGTNLAGAVGLFNGSQNYRIIGNDFCGNYSAEYGGAISHYGYNPNGQINNNRIYFNESYDEGGAIMIAGELPRNSAVNLSQGAGEVNIYSNIIQSNLANDDGGGIRFLMAGNYQYNVYNNFIVNNVSTHEGGGISLNDAPNVRIYNNTIMKNLTTATAATSTGAAAPAGVSSSQNSDLLQATLPSGSLIFSNPVLFNNIFWDNRAGTWDGSGISGIGTQGDPSPINLWDLGVADGAGLLSPVNSMLSVDNLSYIVPSPTNQIGLDPQVVEIYDTSVIALPWRGNPNFVGVILLAFDLPPTQMGDYHVTNTSPALNEGTNNWLGVQAPLRDIDNNVRPLQGSWDIGADERNAVGGRLSASTAEFDAPVTTIPGAAIEVHDVFLPLSIGN